MSPYEVTGNYYFHRQTAATAGIVWNTVKTKKYIKQKRS